MDLDLGLEERELLQVIRQVSGRMGTGRTPAEWWQVLGTGGFLDLDVDDVVRRIKEAAKYFPLENLTVSPQCGFASTAEGNLLTEDEQWAKLKLVVDTARRVWH